MKHNNLVSLTKDKAEVLTQEEFRRRVFHEDLDDTKEVLLGLINGKYIGPHCTFGSNILSTVRAIYLRSHTGSVPSKQFEESYLPSFIIARDSLIKRGSPEEKRKYLKYIQKKIDIYQN